MLGEADLKDFFFFAEPIKTPSQQNTVKYTFLWTRICSHSRVILK